MKPDFRPGNPKKSGEFGKSPPNQRGSPGTRRYASPGNARKGHHMATRDMKWTKRCGYGGSFDDLYTTHDDIRDTQMDRAGTNAESVYETFPVGSSSSNATGARKKYEVKKLRRTPHDEFGAPKHHRLDEIKSENSTSGNSSWPSSPQSDRRARAGNDSSFDSRDNNTSYAESRSQVPSSAGDMQSTSTQSEELFNFDVVKVIPREDIGENDSFDGFAKLLRLFTFIFLMLVLLASTTVAVTTLLLLESAVLKDKIHSWNAQNQLVWILCIPHIFVFIEATMRNIFGERVWPSKQLFFMIWVTEVLHSFGVALLVFRVLPHFGSVFALGLLNACCIVPAILKVIFTMWKCEAECLLIKLFDILALCAQLTALIGPFLVEENAMNTNRNFNDGAVKWQTPLALLLVSIKWWENFVGENQFCLGIKFRQRLKDLKHTIRKSRNIMSSFTSFSNICITVASMVLLDFIYGTSSKQHHLFDQPILVDSSDEIYDTATNDTLNGTLVVGMTNTDVKSSTRISECRGVPCAEQYFENIALCLVCIGCSMLAFFCALVACKLLMQRCSFAIPLMLSSPAALGLILMQCNGIISTIEIGGFEYRLFCPELGAMSIVFCIMWYVSLLWLTRYIWNPHINRLAFADRVFVTKLYCSPLLPQSLLMNRRDDLLDSEDKVEDESMQQQMYPSGQDNIVTKYDESKKGRVIPKIYACGTMWHETRNEMMQLLKSIMRMDFNQWARAEAERDFKIIDPDFYEFEAHIFFDDCLDTDDEDKWIPNKFVLQFVQCVREAACSVHEDIIHLDPPVKRVTPYGGTLTWCLPGGNNMVVHLKDKHKIRHRKRWSQVMYMYYLLFYRLYEERSEEIDAELGNESIFSDDKSAQEAKTQKGIGKDDGLTESAKEEKKQKGYGKAEILVEMSERKLKEAENTFILALDGDVDFKPDAVRLLVDRLKANPKSGAACGRIHPIGSGPLVWYQKFEYAIGHWFQKAAEHVLGCVLCSPGCFSLFRGSALLDDNVMARYTAVPEEPVHYIQFDQGEDRWLCTLLLQQGYRVDYCAAADALTYAPETFNELFNQRRRWTPSTIANIVDLLSDAKNTVNINPNISYLYILYQFMLLVSMILGPSTIILAIATAFQSVFSLGLLESYAFSIAPVIFYIVICFKTKTATQLKVAAFLSTIYACIMTVVLVGIIQTIVTENIFNPTLLFLAVITISFVFAGILHPYEVLCLIHGIIYYLCIPGGYLILMIYSISNLHVVSWGTREVKSKRQMEKDRLIQEKKKNEKSQKKGILAYFHLDANFKEIKDTLTQIFQRSNGVEAKSYKLMKKIYKLMKARQGGEDYEISDSDSETEAKKSDSEKSPPEKAVEVPRPEDDEEEKEIQRDSLTNPNCIKHPGLGNGPTEKLHVKEWNFFTQLIKKYLEPLPKDRKKEHALTKELLALRTNCSFGFWFLNLLWYLFNYMINRNNNLNLISVAGYKTQPLGFVFIIFFVIVLVLQVLGMIKHRWGTFLQLISIAELTSPIKSIRPDGTRQFTPGEAVRLVKELARADTFIEDDDSNIKPKGDLKLDPECIRHNVSELVHRDRRALEERRRSRQRREIAVNMRDHYNRRHPGRHDNHAHLESDLNKYTLERRRERDEVHYRKAIPRQVRDRWHPGSGAGAEHLRYRTNAGPHRYGPHSGAWCGHGGNWHMDHANMVQRRLIRLSQPHHEHFG